MTLLDDIQDIINADVARIKASAATKKLDRTSAGNLVDYAKLQIAIERHQLDQELQAEKSAIKDSELVDLRAKAAAFIAQRNQPSACPNGATCQLANIDPHHRAQYHDGQQALR